MATYAIGDIQGCYQPFIELLEAIQFNPGADKLWLAGDLINRGPDTLKTLRHIVELDQKHQCITAVLGNHDLHFLAVAFGHKTPSKGDTLDALLSAADCQALIDWLRQCPFVHCDQNLGYNMVHAGIPPQWSIAQSLMYSAEVERVLQSDQIDSFLANMYGNQPDIWNEQLRGAERLRTITNYFTRMRFCDRNGKLDLHCKTGVNNAPDGLAPWFVHNNRSSAADKIVFGHWAALEGQTGHTANVYALDTGCVWGGALTALRLEDEKYFSVTATR